MNSDAQLNLLLSELRYSFTDEALLERALTHVSDDRHKSGDHNEVLEFLGDAVLDLAVSDLLMQHNPDKTEGDLSRMRAALVNSTVLAEKAARAQPRRAASFGQGEERSEGRSKPSILAGAFEAILGAVYRDGGYEAARKVVERFFLQDVTGKQLGQQDYKTRLQEISQMLFHAPPTYQVVAEAGPDHEKVFVTEITVGGRVLGKGEGKSKKISEQEAAKVALLELQQDRE